jgi:hypothetical protein
MMLAVMWHWGWSRRSPRPARVDLIAKVGLAAVTLAVVPIAVPATAGGAVSGPSSAPPAAVSPVWLGARPAPEPAPTHWDPRVLALVRFDERARGLSFKHPVPVHFLTESAFQSQTMASEGQLSRSDRRQLEQAARVLTALGLAQVDAATLFSEENALNASQILAFYDSDHKAMFIRGTSLDLNARVTVVHELTHALQDQYFDLNQLNDRASNRGGGASDAMTSLIEGDAVSIENQYVGSLSQSQQDTYSAGQAQQTAKAEGTLSTNVPAVLQALSAAPYDLGPTFVEALVKHGGHQRLNQAFRQPPTTDAQILDPNRYLSGARPLQVPIPVLMPGETTKGPPDTVGALGLYLTLASRIDPLQALQAADGWGADRFVSYQRGASPCIRVLIQGTSPTTTNTIADDLRQWSTQEPAGTSTVTDQGARVALQACQAGPSAVPPDSRIQDASAELANRAALLSQAIDGGLPLTTGLCAANRLVADPTIPALLMTNQPTQAQIDEFQGKIEAAVTACSH